MSTTTISTPHPAPDFRISIFNHPLYRSTAQGFRMPFTAAGLYIKQSLSWDDKDHRSVTQSLAISPPLTRRLYRRSDPGTVCCRHLNFDRFHRTCLQDVGIVVRSKQWGMGNPKQTQHHTSWLWAVTHAALFATQLGNVSEMLVRCRSQVLTTAAVH